MGGISALSSVVTTSAASAPPLLIVTKKRKFCESEQAVGSMGRHRTINAFHRMASALDLAHASLASTCSDVSETTMSPEDARVLLAQLATMMRSLLAGNVNDVVDKVEHCVYADSSIVATEDLQALHTLQQAADCVYNRVNSQLDLSNSNSRAISPTSTPTKRVKPTLQLQRNDDEETNAEEDAPRASVHEAEAAQALTVLRSSSSTAEAPTPSEDDVPPTATPTETVSPLSSPVAPPLQHASYSFIAPTPITNSTACVPNLSPSSTSMSICVPRPSSYPTFNPQVNGYSMTSPTTPGTLPSLFSRGLLTPTMTASPYETVSPWMTSPLPGLTSNSGTPMMTPNGHRMSSYPYVDWKNLPVPPSPHSSTVYPTTNNSIESSGNMDPYVFTPTHIQSPPVNRGHTTTTPLSSTTPTSATTISNEAGQIAKSLAALERTQVARKANPRRWTKDEDDALRTAVENHKEKNWKAIASQVAGRNHTQCLQRWTKVLAPGLVKGHWSPHEDDLLKRLVAGGNKNWGEVAGKIPGRTSKQCRERWHNHLDPHIVRTAYSPEEDRMILEAQARLGNRWSVIAAMLPGRTEDAVKIRWKSHCRIWKARKYLRKPTSSGEPDADDMENDAVTMAASSHPREQADERQDMEDEELSEAEDGTDSDADLSSVVETS